MAANNQTESWNQQNRNKENNAKNKWYKDLVPHENQQNQQIFIQSNQKAERKYEKGYITTDTEEIQIIVRLYFENLYSAKLEDSSWNGSKTSSNIHPHWTS